MKYYAVKNKIDISNENENESITVDQKDSIIDDKLDTSVPDENKPEKVRKTRESKPRASKTAKATKNEVELLAGQIAAAHKIASIFTNVSELEVSDKEAEMLASSITEVLTQYTISINPKVAGWLNLAGVAAMIYGPRGYAIYTRKKSERASVNSSSVNFSENIHETNISENVQHETNLDSKPQPVPSSALDIVENMDNFNYDAELENW